MFKKAIFSIATVATSFFSVSHIVQAQETVVGSIPAEFNVSNGTANYSIPISVAPGRGGMQPELSLNYSSGNGSNGILGVGWSLGGLSSIHRCGQTIAQDGKVRGINFNAEDRYCLDGQRLIPVSGGNGGVGTEYKTEIDGYSQIVSYGGSANNPAYWVIKTKAGQVMTYGGSSGNATHSFPQGNLSWSIREINDTTGNNPIAYDYFSQNNTQYLDEINYSGGRIQVEYEARTDVIGRYFKGEELSQQNRITRVSSFTVDTIFRNYVFNYSNIAHNSFSVIDSITECDANNICVVPTLLDWQSVDEGTFSPIVSNIPRETGNYAASGWIFSGLQDTNGDGFLDGVWVYKGSSSANNGVRIVATLGGEGGSFGPMIKNIPRSTGNYGAEGWVFSGMYDTNADGMLDGVWVYKGSSSANTGVRIAVSLGQGNGQFGAIVNNTPRDSGNYGAEGWIFSGMHDTNADGMLDGVWVYKGSGSANTGVRIAVSLGQGNGQFGAIVNNTPRDSGNYGAEGWIFSGMHDTNADGMLDGVWVYKGSSSANTGVRIAVSLGQGNGQFGAIVNNTPRDSGNYGAEGWIFSGMHDTNADGMLDGVWVYKGSSSANTGVRIAVSLGQGNGQFGAIVNNTPRDSGNYGAEGWIFSGMHDTNADGMLDGVWVYKGSSSANTGVRIAVSLGQGNGQFGAIVNNTPRDSGNYGAEGWIFSGMHDTNADGMLDGVWVYKGSSSANTGVRIAVSLGQGNGQFGAIVNNTPRSTGNYAGENWIFEGMHDVDGNGLLDAVWVYIGSRSSNSGVRIAVSLSLTKPLQLSEITDSNGNITSLSYKPLTDSTVYTKGTGATFPVIDLQYPQYVVSQVETSNGIGGSTSVEYQYEGLKAHVQGRGSYGYSKITETYPNTGKTMVTTYDQTGFPFTGSLLSVVESYNGDKMNESYNTFTATETYPNVYQLNPDQSLQSSYELGNSTQPVTTVTTSYSNIDVYGNIGQVTTATTDGSQTFTKIADSNYTNDTSNWFLGRLSDTTVTHQSPYGSDETRRSAFTYNNSTGLLQAESILDSGGSPLTTTTYSYDAYGQKTEIRVSATGEQDRVTTKAYDNTGRPTQSCNVYNQCETYTYTAEGWLDTTTGPNGISTDIDYDSLGRHNRENRADGTWSTVERRFVSSGECGELAAHAYTCSISQSSGSQPIIVQYDKLGRDVRKIKQGFDDRLVYSDTEYNHLAQVSRVSRDYYVGDTVYWANSEYDPLGRVTRMTEPGPHGTRNDIRYQYNGLTTTTLSGPEARAKTVINNAIGQKVRIEEEEGSYIDYTYNSEGNLLTTTVNNNPDTVITLSYDEFGRKVGMDDPDMGVWSYHYNAFGQLLSQTDAKGQTITMQYDLLGRMVSRQEPEGSSQWVYGDNSAPQGSIGKLLQESGNGLTKDYSYDNLGRPVSTTTSIAGEGSFTTELQYDSLGRVSRTTYPGTQGFYTENVYNDNGFLAAVQGLRASAETHDYSALQPLISEATGLASDYLGQANDLRTLGQYYQTQIAYYQSLTGNGSISSGLQSNLSQHQNQLSNTVTQGQNLSPEFLGHLNNAIDELQTVTALISAQTQSYETIAEQLIVLAEQTLAAADHSFQIAHTLDNSADVYSDYISEGAGNTITYWRAADVDASGRISAEVYGNGIVNDYAYNQATGQLQSIHSSLLVIDAIRHLEYQYDAYQNVTLRDDLVNDIRDTYAYDRLDRLTANQVSSQLYQGSEFNHNQSQSYDGLGNITDKSDVGSYVYGVRPHAVTQAGSNSYQYDANGNMTSGDGRSIQYSSFNKPIRITRNGRSANFEYGPNRSRFKKVNHDGDTTLYLGAYERTTRDNGNQVEQKHYIYAAGQLIAEHIVSTNSGTQTRYLHKDALGSVDLVTDAYGEVVDRRSFDAWGKLRDLPWRANATLNDPSYLTQLPFTNRGYTGHEHVQEVELIHMNGRMYDATLARFISADPHIQAGAMSQSYNRYSYVMNNPLKYTDPSGYFFKKLGNKIKRHIKKYSVGVRTYRQANRNYHKFRAEQERLLRRKWVEQLGYVVAVFCGPFYAVCAGGHAAAVADAHGAEFDDAFRIGVKAGVTAYVSQQAASYIGAQDWSRLGKAFAHGVVGGTISVIQGGKFGDGFVSSFFTKMVSGSSGVKGYTNGNRLTGVAVAALIGGTASALGGGKFANGAATAAMQYAFNELSINHQSASDAEREALIRQVDDELQVIKNALASDSPAAYGATFYDGINANDNEVASLKLEVLQIDLSKLRTALRAGNIASLISGAPSHVSVGKRGIDWIGTGMNALQNSTKTLIQSYKVNAHVRCHGVRGCGLYAE